MKGSYRFNLIKKPSFFQQDFNHASDCAPDYDRDYDLADNLEQVPKDGSKHVLKMSHVNG